MLLPRHSEANVFCCVTSLINIVAVVALTATTTATTAATKQNEDSDERGNLRFDISATNANQQQQFSFRTSFTESELLLNKTNSKWNDFPSNRRKRSHYSQSRSIGDTRQSPPREQQTTIIESTNWTRIEPDYSGPSHCNRFQPPRDFFVIGHSGGDPLKHCENTLEATRSALDEGGANAIEIDLTISKDGVIFLWHDPHPLGIISIVRRMGFALAGHCKPKMDVNRPSHDLTFNEVQDYWYYETNGNRRQKIPTLEEWLNQFGNDPRIKLIWLDVKVNVESKLRFFVDRLLVLLKRFAISNTRLQFSVREVRIGALLQEHFVQAGAPELSALVVTDTQPVVPYVSNDLVHRFDGITKAIPPLRNEYNLKCGCCASLGLPLVVTSKWESFKSIVAFNLSQRKLYGQVSNSHIRVYTYVIDDPDQMDWLLDAGVDGIITNRPGLLAHRISLKYNRFLSSRYRSF